MYTILRNRYIDIQRGRFNQCLDVEIYRYIIDTQKDRWINRQIDKPIDRQIRQIDKWIDRCRNIDIDLDMHADIYLDRDKNDKKLRFRCGYV